MHLLFQDGVEMKVEPTGWGSDDPELEEEDTGPDPVRVLMLPLQAQHAMEKMEEFVLKASYIHYIKPSWVPPPL